MGHIAYDQPVTDFIAALSATGHVTHTKYKKTSVTFHHNGGNLTHAGVLSVWKTRPASASCRGRCPWGAALWHRCFVAGGDALMAAPAWRT